MFKQQKLSTFAHRLSPPVNFQYDPTPMLDVLPIGIKEDNWYKNQPEPFTIPPETRRKHVAIFGATGAGKSTLLKNIAASDLDAGTGITIVDPPLTFPTYLAPDSWRRSTSER